MDMRFKFAGGLNNTGTDDLHASDMKYQGFFRAKVVEVDCQEEGESNSFGGIRVFIPDIHIETIDKNAKKDKTGIMAYPACGFPLGGYNVEDKDKTSYYASSFIVPLPGSYVFVFFEGGNIDQCYYFSSWLGKQTQKDEKSITPVKAPPENRGVDEPHKVYTLLKSGSGRAIIVCDSEDQARIEITGKKRKIKDSDGPHGDSQSVYQIDTNMTTILLDERDGKEKLLIRSHKGDFINFNIEDRKLQIEMESDIVIKTNGKFTLDVKDNIEIKSDATMNIQTSDEINLNAAANINLLSESNVNMKCGGSTQIQSDGQSSFKSGGITGIDAALVLIQTGASAPAQSASEASPETPIGIR